MEKHYSYDKACQFSAFSGTKLGGVIQETWSSTFYTLNDVSKTF